MKNKITVPRLFRFDDNLSVIQANDCLASDVRAARFQISNTDSETSVNIREVSYGT